MSTTNILDLNNRIDELEKNSGGGGSADSAKRSDIATEFSTETSYTAGNFVYYEGKLYQFNADHSAGAWDPTDVVEANVTDQIVSNASAIAGLTANVKMKKLWENSDPTETFAAQSVQLSSIDFDLLMIIARFSNGSNKNIPVVIGSAGYLNFADATVNEYRGYEVSANTVVFADAVKGGNTDNTKLIPYQIYSIKLT